MRVNFSISENEQLKFNKLIAEGKLAPPAGRQSTR